MLDQDRTVDNIDVVELRSFSKLTAEFAWKQEVVGI